jgi:hypothetical protein
MAEFCGFLCPLSLGALRRTFKKGRSHRSCSSWLCWSDRGTGQFSISIPALRVICRLGSKGHFGWADIQALFQSCSWEI